jgi:hypothetical protein
MLLGQNRLRRLATRTQTPQPTKLRFAAAEMLSICPESWQDRLAQLANRPHTYLPLQVFNEADNPSQLFQYYLLDTTGFEPNVFTTIFPGVNDHVQLSVTAQIADCLRWVPCASCWSPSLGCRSTPTDPRAFNDVFTDISVVRHQQREWLVRRVDDPRHHCSQRRPASQRRARAIRNDNPARCRAPREDGYRE